MSVRISQELAARLDFRQGLEDEIAQPPDRLPSDIAEQAVTSHVDEYSERIRDRCIAGFEPASVEVIWMPKGFLSYRPLAALPLMERALLRALARDCRAQLSDLDQPRDSRSSFETDLLEDDREFSHFALTDVTSFYRYVPHALVRQRVLEGTGRADLAQAVHDLLGEVMRASIGLPQNVGASDLFADLVIAPVERRLVRAGVAVTRYNDDFRIGACDNRSVRAGIELLQSELHRLGFALNEAKTTIMVRDTYDRHVADASILEYVEGEDEIQITPTATDLQEAETDLQEALTEAGAPRSRAQEARAMGTVRRVLKRFETWGHLHALDHIQAIVNRYPVLAQEFGRYAAALNGAGHSKEVAKQFKTVLPKLILTAWQEVWLLEPFVAGAQPTRGPLAKWLRSRLDQPSPPLLQARAALALAEAGLLSAEDAGLLIDSLPEVARPDAIRAFAMAHSKDPEKASELSGLSDPVLAQWIYDL